MHVVRVDSLEKLETQGSQMRLSANAGSLSIVFPQEVWENLLANAPTFEEPTPEELEELDRLKDELEGYAAEESYGRVLRQVPCGDSGLAYDLVLRPAGLFAMTTAYLFAPVVGTELLTRMGAGLEDDDAMEQAYVVGAVAEDDALLSDDERLKVLCVRGRTCSTSRFEMPPELWQVLSGRLGWRDVRTITTGR
jgi:hypothetical protein